MEIFYYFQIGSHLFDTGLRKYPSLSYFIKQQKNQVQINLFIDLFLYLLK